MTIHIKKRHYQIPRNGIQLVYVRKSGMWTVFMNNKNCLQRYKYESVYGWYTKVISITGFQNLRYIFRYMISLLSERYTNKKKTYKIVYRPFFVAVQLSIEELKSKSNIICIMIKVSSTYFILDQPWLVGTTTISQMFMTLHI